MRTQERISTEIDYILTRYEAKLIAHLIGNLFPELEKLGFVGVEIGALESIRGKIRETIPQWEM